ncbi:MAG: hypothetical protein GY725_06135 [bacterium]|nr:hypothetical protein [bacterium]
MKSNSMMACTALSLFLFLSCRTLPEEAKEFLSEHGDEIHALVEALEAGNSRRPSGGLLVRLAFGPQADLDLFVTAPDQETVYFANSPTRLGGTLARDVRCGETPPAIERVLFPGVQPGRYRVGIDFPRRCDAGDAAVPYALHIEHDGGAREAQGLIRPGEFLTIVLEEDVGTTTPK